jgi:hypothetical protein
MERFIEPGCRLEQITLKRRSVPQVAFEPLARGFASSNQIVVETLIAQIG